MTRGPEFDDLVGEDGTPEERERLRRVHDLIVQAGPPPELSPALATPPTVGARVLELRRRRPATTFGLVAAAIAAALIIGVAIGTNRNGFDAAFTVPMHGIGTNGDAVAAIGIGKRDIHGNYPLRMTVRGLQPLPTGGWYTLYLSKKGKATLPCGTFIAGQPPTTVRLSVGYPLEIMRPGEYDGWVVEEHLPGQPESKDRVVMVTTDA